MAVPPSSPASSDIEGVSRDRSKSIARGKPAEDGQQEDLAALKSEDVARPIYDPEITPEGNSR